MKKFAIFCVICVAAFSAWYGITLGYDGLIRGTGREAVVTVHPLGQTDTEVMQDVKQAGAVFPQLMEEKFQLKLQRDTEIWLAADTGKYENLLTGRLGLEKENAPQKAKYTNGQSSGSKALVAIDGEKKKLGDRSERFSTTGHELFHQMQYELSDGHSGYENSLFWLEEGTADYVGALLCEKMGGRSVEKWYLDAMFTLQNAKVVADISQLQHTTDEDRLKLMTAQAKHYTLADVMTMYLLQRYGGENPEQKIAAYYKGLEKGEAEPVFAQTFGVELAEFLRDFSGWWQSQLAEPVKFDVVVRSEVFGTAAAQFQQQVKRSRQWLQNIWGNDLHGHYTLVLVGSSEDFADAMQEYCHVSEAEARNTADGSVWAENNSTLFVNLSRVTEQRQAVFVSGTMISRLFMMQQLKNDHGDIAWLLRGASYVAGVARLVEMGQGTLPAYQRAWRKDLRQNAPLPTLDKLLTTDELLSAMNQHGSEPVSQLCEYAAAELINRYGWGSLYNWQLMTYRTGDAKQAFAQVYGLTISDFAAQVHLMIY